LIDYGGAPSVTQMMERCNKNHNFCAVNSRLERSINARMTVRSVLIDCGSNKSLDQKRDASDGKEFVRRIFKRCEEIRSHLFDKENTFEQKKHQEVKATFNLFGEHTRTLGAAEQRRGYTETSNQEDKVRIGMTNSDMTVAYREECLARGITHATGRSARNTKVPKSFPIEHAGIEARLLERTGSLTIL